LSAVSAPAHASDAGSAAAHTLYPAIIIGGAGAPELNPKWGSGTVVASCTIDTDGIPCRCAIVSNTGSAALAGSVMAWLTGPNALRYRPASQAGRAVVSPHRWTITFDGEPARK
jgi:hypothetical protein